LGLDPLAENPQDVLVAGDWHGQTSWANLVMRTAPRNADGGRIVIVLGDFGVWPGRAGAAFLNDVARGARRTGTTVLFLDGNHEDYPQLMSYPMRPDGLRVVRPRVYHLPRGFRWSWAGLQFAAVGGAVRLADSAQATTGMPRASLIRSSTKR
jgi:hypothetical protein